MHRTRIIFLICLDVKCTWHELCIYTCKTNYASSKINNFYALLYTIKFMYLVSLIGPKGTFKFAVVVAFCITSFCLKSLYSWEQKLLTLNCLQLGNNSKRNKIIVLCCTDCVLVNSTQYVLQLPYNNNHCLEFKTSWWSKAQIKQLYHVAWCKSSTVTAWQFWMKIEYF